MRPAWLLFLFFLAWFGLSQSPWIDDWDSVNFLLALDDFDLVRNQPHVPGFPVFVFIANVFELSGLSPAGAMHVVNVVFGAGGIVFVFLLARRWCDVCGAMVVALVTAFTPVFWLTASVLMTDTAAFAFMAGGLLLTLSAGDKGGWRSWLSAGLVSGLASGVRLHALFLLLPALVVAAYFPGAAGSSATGKRGRAWLIPGLVAGVLVWLIPTILLHDWQGLVAAVDHRHHWRYGNEIASILGHDDAGVMFYLERLWSFVFYYLNLANGLQAPLEDFPRSRTELYPIALTWLWGCVWLVRSFGRSRPLIIGLLVYGVMLYVYLPPTNARYFLPFLPLQGAVLVAMWQARDRLRFLWRIVSVWMVLLLVRHAFELHRILIAVPPPAQAACEWIQTEGGKSRIVHPQLLSRHAEFALGPDALVYDATDAMIVGLLKDGVRVFSDTDSGGIDTEENAPIEWVPVGSWDRDIRAHPKASHVNLLEARLLSAE